MRCLICSVVLLLASATVAFAQDCCGSNHCCANCGCQCACQKFCRLEQTTKKVPKVEYCCECEDFCVPGKSEHCVTYDECGCKQHCYTPTCGKVYTRVKLVKQETMIEKPATKCVVVYLCDRCANNCDPCNSASAAAPNTGAIAERSKASDAIQASFNESRATADKGTAESTGGTDLKGQLRRMLKPIFSK